MRPVGRSFSMRGHVCSNNTGFQKAEGPAEAEP